MRASRRPSPFLAHGFADRAYRGERVGTATCRQHYGCCLLRLPLGSDHDSAEPSRDAATQRIEGRDRSPEQRFASRRGIRQFGETKFSPFTELC
jgi:hypothetical protein